MELPRLLNALSSVRHAWEFHDPGSAPKSAVDALLRLLPQIPPDSWPARFSIGGVYLNGRRILEDRPLTPPARLEYYAPKFDPFHPEAYFPQFDPARIVYEDSQIIAYYKPPGLPTMPVKEQRLYSLRRYLDLYLGRAAHVPSRLDTSAGGIVLASKSPEHHHAVQLLFERRRIIKRYLIDVGSEPIWEWTVVNREIGRDRRHPVLRRPVPAGGKPALTFFSKPGPPFATSIVCAEPKTGRTHQIRVHAASLGLPIVGDNFYGGREAESLRLLAFSLEFEHPATGAAVKIELPRNHWPDWVI